MAAPSPHAAAADRPLRVAAILDLPPPFARLSHRGPDGPRLSEGRPAPPTERAGRPHVQRPIAPRRPEPRVLQAEGDRAADRAETLGKDGGLDVDAVALIVEHGDYPLNDFGQVLYPRYEYFQEVVKVFQKTGKSVPVFVDKHLSYDHQKAAEMVATAKKLGFSLMAGSSLPVTWRVPQIEPPLETEFEEAVATFGFDRGAGDLPDSWLGSPAMHAGATEGGRNGRQVGRLPARRRRLESRRRWPPKLGAG
jgi:hypothetical protein